jgi:hypothetical protein
MVKLLIALALIVLIEGLHSADVFDALFKRLGDYSE